MTPHDPGQQDEVGLCTSLATSCGVTKMPAPITLPITSMVTSNSPSLRASSGACGPPVSAGSEFMKESDRKWVLGKDSGARAWWTSYPIRGTVE